MIKWCVEHKSIVILLCAAVLVFGFGMYPLMEMQENPQVSSPIATVQCVYPGAAPEDVEKDIIKPLEDHIDEIADIKSVESYCMDSVGVVKVELEDMSDDKISEKWDELKDKVDDAQTELPDSAYEPEVETDFTSSYGLILGISSNDYSYEQLNDVADSLRDELKIAEGVKAVDIDGEITRQISVDLDLNRLQQYGLSLSDIGTYLQARNINIPGGNLELGSAKVPVQISGEYGSVEEIGNTIIGMSTDSGNTVHLRDVADIYKTDGDTSMRATVNDEKGVLVGVKFADGENIPHITERLNGIIEDFEADELYKGMHLTRIIDQSVYINDALDLLNSNLFSAVLLVLIVILIAMGVRSAVIVALPIPIVIAAVFAYMDLTDIPLHQVSIMSLIISLSLLVANGIVSNDNMNVYLDRGEDRMTACTKGVKEVAMPILTSTLTTIASFLPLAMMDGSEGKFVKTLPILVSVALAASYVTSLTLVPAMGHRLLLDKKQKEERKKKHKPILQGKGTAIYESILKKCLKLPLTTIMVFVVIFAASLFVIPTLKVQLFPPVEREQYVVDVTLKEGSTTDKTAEVVSQICGILDEDDTVTSYASEIGTGFMKYYVTFMPNQQASNRAQILVNGSRDEIATLEDKIALLHYVKFDSQIQHIAHVAYALAVHYIKLGCLKWRGNLVFNNLCLSPVAHNFGTVFNSITLSYFNTYAGIKLKCTTACGGFGIAVGYTDFFPELIDKDNYTLAFCRNTRKLSQCLTHKSCLQAHMGISHFSLDFSLWHKCGNGIHDNNVNSTGTHHGFRNFKRLLTVIGLGYVKLVNIYSEIFGINRVKSMLRIHKARYTPKLLHLCHYMQCNGGFSAAFRTIYFNYPSLWHTAHTKSNVKCKGTCGHGFHGMVRYICPKLHNCALAKIFFYLSKGSLKGLLLSVCHIIRSGIFCSCHLIVLRNFIC